MKVFYFLILLLLCIKAALFAQAPKISFEHLNMRNGLPGEYVSDIWQDEKGYIWLSNLTGLTRYDGYHIKSYNTSNARDDFNGFIFQMFQDSRKALFVCTAGGDILRYDPVLDSLVMIKKGLNKSGEGLSSQRNFSDANNCIWTLYAKNRSDFFLEQYDPAKKITRKFSRSQKGRDFFGAEQIRIGFISPAGDIIIATTNGFYSYDYKEQRFKSYLTAKDSLGRLNVTGIYREPTGEKNIWLMANTLRDKKTVFYRYNLQTALLKPCVTLPGEAATDGAPIVEDKKGRLVMLTTAGLFLYDKASNQKKVYPFPATDKPVRRDDVRDILVDSDNIFWISTYVGLFTFNPATGSFQHYTANQSEPDALAHIHVLKVFEDRTGLKWVGMDEYGVDRVNTLHAAFTGVKNNPGKPGSYPENVTGIALKPDGDYWLTSQLGLFSWDVKKNIFRQVIPPGKKVNGYCYSPLMLPGGALCYADEAGLNIYDKNGKIQSISLPDKEQRIRDFYKDNEANYWVITIKGRFFRFDPQKKAFERYTYVNPLGIEVKIDTIGDVTSSDIFEDAAGTLWLSHSKIGLNKVNRAKKQVVIIPALQGKVFKDINAMYQDKTGTIWLGTIDNGLWEFGRKTEKLVRRIKDDQGILSSFISGFAEDKNANLWISTPIGLVKYNYKTNVIIDYTVADNIPLEVPSTTLTTPDGHIVLSMFNSLLTFNPDDIKTNPVPPQVQVESVVYSDPAHSEKGLHTVNALNSTVTELAYNNNRIAFNYVALHYIGPARNKYAYRLEGYATTWTQAQNQRTVTYNNLAPGTYTFMVKAANSDGVWNNTGASYIVIINPPWWSRWWAWMLYVLVFASAIYAFIYYRSRQLIHQNKLLEQRISLRTAQLSEANEELQSKQEEITSQRDQLADTLDDLKNAQTQLVQSEKMASLGELTAGIAHEIQNPLNFVNNFSDVSIELVDEMESDLKNGDQEEAIAIAADIRQNLEKIIHHGKRADAIVKNMLQHSSTNSGTRQLTNLNAIADEYLRLAYHGLRAKNKDFNAIPIAIGMVTHFAEDLPAINVISQDISRVMLNLYNNAFYALQQKQQTAGIAYKPIIEVTTFAPATGGWGIKVADNGNGIPDAIKNKIIQPFFTTKPTGEGTGLGLSLSYDIVVKGHGGIIEVTSVEGEGAEFVVVLPVG